MWDCAAYGGSAVLEQLGLQREVIGFRVRRGSVAHVLTTVSYMSWLANRLRKEENGARHEFWGALGRRKGE